MAWQQRVRGEALGSFLLALLSIVMWHGIMPLVNFRGLIRQWWVWSDFLGFISVGASYYLTLTMSLAIVRRFGATVNPISQAYIGSWLIIAATAVLGVYDPLFSDIIGMSLQTGGAYFLFLALIVGAVKFWRENHLDSLAEDVPGEVGGQPQTSFKDRDARD